MPDVRSICVLRYVRLPLVLLAMLLPGLLRAQPVLHEYFDVTSEQQTGPRDVPRTATAQGSSNPVPGARSPEMVSTERTGGVYAPITEEDGYRLDGNTSRPSSVAYDDPFVPSIPVFKRLFAYNAVGPDFEMVVYPQASASELQTLTIGGQAEPLEDQFHAALDVTIPAEGLAVRIPSVGPRTRVLGARLSPQAPFRVRTDAAENWFLEVDEPGAYRLSMHLSIHRAAFAAGFDNVAWSDIADEVPPLSAAVREAAARVLSKVGISRARMSPGQALSRLVNHFRDFEAYDGQQTGQGATLYTSIALGGRGVCRHRSFAFVVSALALGIPARLIRNEAHAWVEVFDGSFWRRVDLGGAAGSLDMAGAFEQRYNTPEDPYVWPLRSESAASAVERELQAAGLSTDAPNDLPGAQAPSLDAQSSEPSPSRAATPATSAAPPNDQSQVIASERAMTILSIAYRVKDVLRGARFELRGTAQAASGESCSLLRVDISLQGESGRLFALGSLVTSEGGEFMGQLTVPSNVPVGDYRVYAEAPGDLRCGPGSATSD